MGELAAVVVEETRGVAAPVGLRGQVTTDAVNESLGDVVVVGGSLGHATRVVIIRCGAVTRD